MSGIITFAEGLRRMGLSRSQGERLIRDPRSDFLRPFRFRKTRFYREADVEGFVARKALEAQSIAQPTTNPEAASAPPPAHAASGATHCVPLAAVGQADPSR